MDIKLEKPKGLKAIFRARNLPYLGVPIAIYAVWLIMELGTSSLRVDVASIAIESVEFGDFNEYINISATAQPISTVQLSPLEGGVVEKIVVEEGSSVKRGDVLAVLSNSALNLSILDSEAQLAEKQNFLRNTQVAMEQERLSLRKEMLQLDLDVTRKLRAYNQAKSLYEDELIAKEEFLIAREDYELAISSRDLVLERQMQDSIYRSVQIEQMEESLENMRRNMLLVRQRVDNLSVKSPLDGELGLLEVVLGQSIAAGTKIGQVNDLSNFKLEAQISEHYIDRVTQGLEAVVERNGESYSMVIRKVFPEVDQGLFRAEFKFISSLPDNIRAGQTYYLNLQLGQHSKAVIVPKGSFYQATRGKWIFVVNESGTKAYRREIKIGRQNPLYYEVLEGLSSGERVIVSGYERYGDSQTIILSQL